MAVRVSLRDGVVVDTRSLLTGQQVPTRTFQDPRYRVEKAIEIIYLHMLRGSRLLFLSGGYALLLTGFRNGRSALPSDAECWCTWIQSVTAE